MRLVLMPHRHCTP
ncbi:hypothetical protein HaLaN_01727, partial [Haematococcus lacustris]